MIMSMDILESLHYLLANNVIGDKQYHNRFVGFSGELAFNEWYRNARPGSSLIRGGFLLPQEEGAETLKKPVYLTIAKVLPSESDENVYSKLTVISKSLYFVHYEVGNGFDTWDKEDVMGINVLLPIPKISVFKYDISSMQMIESDLPELLSNFELREKRGRPKYSISDETRLLHILRLKGYEQSDLMDLYVERLVFDGMIGFGRVKGIPSDIDAIVKKNDRYTFLEIKEKDMSKKPPRGFGMDTGRIETLIRLQALTGIDYYYVVREVFDQNEREFKQWHIISMTKFVNVVQGLKEITGGTGMRSSTSHNPTKVCPIEYFKYLV